MLGGYQRLAALPRSDVTKPTIRRAFALPFIIEEMFIYLCFFFLFSCWDLLPFPFWGVCPVVVGVAYCYDYFPAIASCTSRCTLLYTMLTRQSAEHGADEPKNGMSFPHSVSPSPSVHRPNFYVYARAGEEITILRSICR